MMARFPLALLLLLALVPASAQVPNQERGQWRATSTTARGVTGDIALTETRLIMNFAGFTIAQIRTLEPAEVAAIFHETPSSPESAGNLYRTDIAGSKRFLHKNTLCGAEDVQWVVTSVNGRTLQVAMFSGSAMPQLTAEAVSNTTSLCGTYSYTR